MRVLLVLACSLALFSNSAAGAEGLTLSDFFRAALDSRPELVIARENYLIAQSRKRGTTGELLPQVTAYANFSDNRRKETGSSSEAFDGERYSIQLSQVIFDWRAFSARRRASAIEDQEEAKYFGEVARTLTDVAMRYFEVLEARDEIGSLKAEVEAVSKQRDQIQSLYDRQLVQVTDLYEASASLAATQARMLEGESELIIRTEQLRAISGLAVGQLYRLPESQALPALAKTLDEYVEDAYQSNYEVLAAEHGLRASEQQIEEARAAFMPTMSLVAQASESDTGYDNRPINEAESTYIGVDVSVPIFRGGISRAGLAEANSRKSIALNQLNRAKLDSNGRVRAAFLQVQTSFLRIDAAKKYLESASLSAAANRKGFELGVVTSVDVLNSIRDRFIAERNLQRARYQYINYLLALEREAGQLEPDDLQTINSWLVSP